GGAVSRHRPVPAKGRSAQAKGRTAPAKGNGGRGRGRRRWPLWTKVCIGFGAVLMMASGVGLIVTPLLVARYEGSVNKADLFRDGDTGTRPEAQSRVRADGPLNILLAGVDTRPDKPDEAPHADSVMILHVPRTRDRAYLFSLARDTLVDIPAYAPAKFSGGRGKL